ncbi:unnamed protein product [Amoebophrya sp. A25]|nr:unnamed protein product [Amoebophrya sp. A25]|eukprot:GSA25T00003008001.1
MPFTAKATKRIQKDIASVSTLSLENTGCWVDPKTFDKAEWHVYIQGPVNTPWEKGVFKLKMSFPDNYPFEPVKINFEKGIYHPNVGSGGTICLDIIKREAWSPSYTLQSVFTSIRSLLSDPNPASPMNGESARCFNKNKKEYERKVQETVQAYGQCLMEQPRQKLHSEKPDEKTLQRIEREKVESGETAAGAQIEAANIPRAVQAQGGTSTTTPSTGGGRAAPAVVGNTSTSRIPNSDFQFGGASGSNKLYMNPSSSSTTTTTTLGGGPSSSSTTTSEQEPASTSAGHQGGSSNRSGDAPLLRSGLQRQGQHQANSLQLPAGGKRPRSAGSASPGNKRRRGSTSNNQQQSRQGANDSSTVEVIEIADSD